MIAHRACVAVALLALAGLGRAAETLGVLPVAASPGPSPELVSAAGELRKAIAERNSGVLDTQQLRDRMTGKAPGATLAELDRAYGGARASYGSGDYEGSVRTLRAILEELEKLPDSEEVFSQWQRALLRLAREESDLGNADVARGTIERLVRAAPQVDVDSAQYPPKFIRLVDEVKAQQKALPSRKLTVTSQAKGARVFLNGRDVGTAPVTLSLARGAYRVTGVLGTTRTPASPVDLSQADVALTLDFTIPDSLRPNLGPGLALADGQRARQLVAVGGFLRLDAVLAASFVEEGGVQYLAGALYDVRRGMLTREGRVRLSNQAVPYGGTNALADFLVTGQATSTLVEIPGGAKPDLRAPAKVTSAGPDLQARVPGEVKTTPMGWWSLGTGAAGVALGGVAIWQASVSNDKYAKARGLLLPGGTIPADNSAYNKFLSDGDSARGRAIGIGAAAGACVVTSVVLTVLSHQFGPIHF